MKRIYIYYLASICVIFFSVAGAAAPVASVAETVDQDSPAALKSSTLTNKAWQALAKKDIDAVIAYTNESIDLDSAKAKEMQSSMTGYATGDARNIFSYWPLNDVATSLYIQGEAYRKAKRMDEAKAAFNRIINEFFYGQTYDPRNKTFWKPVEGAQDSLYMIENNLDLNYGTMASNFLVQRMWESLAKKDLGEVIAYDKKLEHLYRKEARDMQMTLKGYASGSNGEILKYWALNDAGAGMFILGEAYRASNRNEDAINAYKKVISDYSYAQCWDAQGWFWKPADGARQGLAALNAK